MKDLEILEYYGEGFKPLVDFQTWRAALTRYGDKQDVKNIDALSRHLETDELFVLLDGSCTIYTAGNQASPTDNIKCTAMLPQTFYNVKKGTWHARSLTPDSCILIVENSDTGAHNSESLPMSDSQRAQLCYLPSLSCFVP